MWVFGIIERNSNKLMLSIVKKRNKKTLDFLIKKHVRPTIGLICSDEWSAYKHLKLTGYNHKSVKHATNFINPNDPNVHSQTIERTWGILKTIKRKIGRFNCTD